MHVLNIINYNGTRERNTGFWSFGGVTVFSVVPLAWLGGFCLFSGGLLSSTSGGTTVFINPITCADSENVIFSLTCHPEVAITPCNSLGFYAWFPGHFPKLVQPLAFWTSGFKYCQIKFKSCVEAWWVHHCPQFKKHYRGHDIAPKKAALIPPCVKGTPGCAAHGRPRPCRPEPREPATLSLPPRSLCTSRDAECKTRCKLFFKYSSDLALNFP